jgi:uncharacterized protein (TIGR00369 family)
MTTTPTPDRSPSTTTGLEQLRAAFAATAPRVGLGATLGMEVGAIEEGTVTFSLVPHAGLGNPLGIVHGGVAATLLDSALSCAVHTTLAPGERYTTVDLHVHYTRAVGHDHGRITATGTVVHRGNRIATAEGRIVDDAGRLVAHGTVTCLVMGASGDGDGTGSAR